MGPQSNGTATTEHREPCLCLRQLHVVEWTARGLSIGQIAAELGLSERTVKRDREAVLRFFTARQMVDAAKVWRRTLETS